MNQQQQTSFSQQQQLMPQPPNVLSRKDELYVTDMLSWNLTAMKKCHFYANQCQDNDIKQALNKAGQMHQRHYEQLLQQLQPTAKQSQQPMQ